MSFAEALCLPPGATAASHAERELIVGRLGWQFYRERAERLDRRRRARAAAYAAAADRYGMRAVVAHGYLQSLSAA